MGTAGRDQHVVYRTREPIEKTLECSRIIRVERRGAQGIDVERSALKALWISAGEDDIGALFAGSSGGFKTDPGAAADDDDRLTEQFRFGPVQRCTRRSRIHLQGRLPSQVAVVGFRNCQANDVTSPPAALISPRRAWTAAR